jgi:MinD superfamily P-loop ATPase
MKVSQLRIAIASGKGGTGKTTVATNLALVSPVTTCYADCDVEEPNGHLFLQPLISRTARVTRPTPVVREDVCDLCGICADACRFNAIAAHPHGVVVFNDLCHSCGGCAIACPLGAIGEELREVGVVEKGRCGDVHYVGGRLNVGEAIIPPVVNAVKDAIPADELTIIDASPGTACPVIAAVRDADYCLLVTEPTPFGLNDLALAVEMTRKLGVPFGVLINRDGIGNGDTERYCNSENIPVLMKIPDDRRIAEVYSRGDMVIDEIPEIREKLLQLLGDIVSRVGGSA